MGCSSYSINSIEFGGEPMIIHFFFLNQIFFAKLVKKILLKKTKTLIKKGSKKECYYDVNNVLG